MTSPEDWGPRNIPRVLLLSYVWLWLLEGVLRKWIMPAFQQPLYFLRVIVVIVAISYALSKLRRPWPWGAICAVALVVAVVIFTATHVVSGEQTITQAVLGTRLWLELGLTPLALGPLLTRRDVLLAARHVIAVSFPIALLALVQVTSPASARINKLLESDGSDNFGNAGGVIRATSVFTSSAGHSAFVLLAASCVFMTLLSPIATRCSRRTALVCLPMVFMMVITSGSRSAIFGLGLILAIVMPALLRGTSKDALRVGLTAVLALGLALWLGPRLAPDAIAAILARLAGDGTAIEPTGRVAGALFGWMLQLADAPVWGRGLGSTAQGLVNLGGTMQQETELDQWMVQLGPSIFVLALTMRCAAVIYLLGLARDAVRRGAKEAAPVASLVLIFWTSGPISSQGSINGMGVLVATFLVGLAERSQGRTKRDQRTGDTGRTRTPLDELGACPPMSVIGSREHRV